ncbi:MAG: haloalkane dehalogenase [Desulfobacterales bacterium]|nr:haloalkane dehalogenase [Desulfobacterales bacterium]
MISAKERFAKKEIEISGRMMAYVDEGTGDPIVLLHGNPTSSYLWRNIIPYLTDLGRCIAPDLIGMGDSDKLDSRGIQSYRLAEHQQYIDALLETLEIHQDVVLVLHDWGSSLGFDWAKRHREAVQGIAYMEAIVQPLTWEDWPQQSRAFFKALRSPDGEKMILEKNLFIETVLPKSVLRNLTEAEMTVYRRPFRNPGEDRRPTLSWPREIPINGEPKDVVEIVKSYGKWLESADVPKLFINADPGTILVGSPREYCRSWPNQEEVTVKGWHFVQEDSPDEIGTAIRNFIKRLRL